ncbi:MAG: hypothetical protein WD847_14115 [Pirellulales bacterium]
MAIGRHRVHEQIMPAINRAGGQVVFTDSFVVHAGQTCDQGTRRQGDKGTWQRTCGLRPVGQKRFRRREGDR